MTKRAIAVIPARMGSSRYPGKPLAKISGLSMIEHVRRRVLLSDEIADAVVATCDEEIMDEVAANGGKAIMTANTHERCTDRVAEAMDYYDGDAVDIVVVVQGDEPLLDPSVLGMLTKPFGADDTIQCTNLLSTITDEGDFNSVDVVKAELKRNQDVLTFSRAPIPYLRDGSERPMLRQTGLSAFDGAFLRTFTTSEPTPLEIVESVDFLRILEHGFAIRGVVYDARTVGVDRPEDVAVVEDILRQDPQQVQIFKQILVQ